MKIGRAPLPAALLGLVLLSSLATAEEDAAATIAPSAASAVNTLPTVNVTATGERDAYLAPLSNTGTRTQAAIAETPISIDIITQQIIQDQAPRELRDLYQNVSGVQPAYTAGNVGAIEVPIIRGFEVFNIYQNGFSLGQIAPPAIDNIQSIEILKGPGAVLYGLNEPGGVLNITTKQPQFEPAHLFEQQFGSFNYYKTLIDFTGPVPGTDNTLFYRLVGSYLNSARSATSSPTSASSSPRASSGSPSPSWRSPPAFPTPTRISPSTTASFIHRPMPTRP